MTSESELIEGHQDYEALIEPIADQMMRSVWSVTQNADDAEEAFQEALSVVWRKLKRVQCHPNPHALILRICINSAYDVLRKKIRRQRREALANIHTIAPPRTPSDAAAMKEQESAIFRAISRLSRNQSLAVTLRLVQGKSYGDIAKVLGCRDVTARKHVARGRARLREILAPIASHLTEECHD